MNSAPQTPITTISNSGVTRISGILSASDLEPRNTRNPKTAAIKARMMINIVMAGL